MSKADKLSMAMTGAAVILAVAFVLSTANSGKEQLAAAILFAGVFLGLMIVGEWLFGLWFRPQALLRLKVALRALEAKEYEAARKLVSKISWTMKFSGVLRDDLKELEDRLSQDQPVEQATLQAISQHIAEAEPRASKQAKFAWAVFVGVPLLAIVLRIMKELVDLARGH
jgi:hypothetical protein